MADKTATSGNLFRIFKIMAKKGFVVFCGKIKLSNWDTFVLERGTGQDKSLRIANGKGQPNTPRETRVMTIVLLLVTLDLWARHNAHEVVGLPYYIMKYTLRQRVKRSHWIGPTICAALEGDEPAIDFSSNQWWACDDWCQGGCHEIYSIPAWDSRQREDMISFQK